MKRGVKENAKDATKKDWKNFENLSKEEIIQNGGGGDVDVKKEGREILVKSFLLNSFHCNVSPVHGSK
jgi:hypothetical protein